MSGPFGYPPVPPNGLFVNSFSSTRDKSLLLLGVAENANTCSPGIAKVPLDHTTVCATWAKLG